MKNAVFLSAAISALHIGAALAQNGSDAKPVDVEQSAVAPLENDAAATDDSAPAPVEPQTPQSEQEKQDNMADDLNARQELRQTFTLERTIDGEVVESAKRTVTYDRSIPFRETEAGQSALEMLKAAFDRELLTRTEAFEEAKLDFTAADVNRDGKMTRAEFATLVESWRGASAAPSDDDTEEASARKRQYDAFLAEIDPDTAKTEFDAHADKKFSFMAGMSDTISREDYVREYLLDFDSMDTDKDNQLKGDELLRFRALNRGETLDM
ncbi:MAG: hypothetical protein AAGC95_15970 [Pseudomonadota bacterium]